MVNQILFGETLNVLESTDEWFKIQSIYDKYEGWVTYHMISGTNNETAHSEPKYIATSLTNPVTLPDQLINAPMGSLLTGYDEETRLLWDPLYKYHGTFRTSDRGFEPDFILKTIYSWVNAPYLWGGKTFMGVDCSGFVQTCFKVQGIKLHRDAWQQAKQGTTIKDLKDAQFADLAFFHNKQGRIVHVGIILEGNRIVHASGKVRIDRLTTNGILNSETKSQTHELHSIRRVI